MADPINTKLFQIPNIPVAINQRAGERVEFKQTIDDDKVILRYVIFDKNSSVKTQGTAATRSLTGSDAFAIDPKIDTKIFSKVELDKALKATETKALLDNSFRELKSDDPRVTSALTLPTEAIDKLNSTEVPYAQGAEPKSEFEDLIYPEKVSLDQDYIIFNILRYNKRTISTSSLFTWDARYDAKKTLEQLEDAKGKKLLLKGFIRLPIQSGISDSNPIDWTGDGSMNILELAAAGVSASIQEGTGLGEILDGMLQAAKDEGERQVLEGLRQGIIAWSARKAANSGSNAETFFSRITGAIYNPNLELLFVGPQLRQFNFTFRLTPRSKKEGETVRKIIRTFKETSAVQRGVGDIFLKAPYIYSIRYMFKDKGHLKAKDHPGINRIKLCALQNMSVNYIPDGTYMTYEDDYSTMTCYELSLSFTELEPVYADDYQNTLNSYNIKDDEIGF